MIAAIYSSQEEEPQTLGKVYLEMQEGIPSLPASPGLQTLGGNAGGIS